MQFSVKVRLHLDLVALLHRDGLGTERRLIDRLPYGTILGFRLVALASIDGLGPADLLAVHAEEDVDEDRPMEDFDPVGILVSQVSPRKLILLP